MTWWTLLAVLIAGAALAAMRRRREDQYLGPPPARSHDEEIDRAALEQAEREVRDLPEDAKGRPLEDVVGDDWGPGTPKPPYF